MKTDVADALGDLKDRIMFLSKRVEELEQRVAGGNNGVEHPNYGFYGEPPTRPHEPAEPKEYSAAFAARVRGGTPGTGKTFTGNPYLPGPYDTQPVKHKHDWRRYSSHGEWVCRECDVYLTSEIEQIVNRVRSSSLAYATDGYVDDIMSLFSSFFDRR